MANVFAKKRRMTEKLRNLSQNIERQGGHGKYVKGFILNADNRCNFTCPHCYTKSGAGDFGNTTLQLEDIRRLADEADLLGVYEIDIQGGEPLLNPELFNILDAIGTDRFYVYITTNGWLLDREVAEKLAEAGIDRVSVSIDAFTEAEHDEFRCKKGSFARALQALEFTKAAGMKPYVNIVVGHYNAQSKELEEFLDYLDEKGYGIVFNCASPTGNWRGNYEAMLTDEDSRHLEKLKEKHRNIIRDLWNYLNPKDKLIYGCPAVNLFYVSPLGDILPCPYIHTRLGNIKEEPLEKILEAGFKIKYFRDQSDKCLVGENIGFAKKYLDQEVSILQPMDMKQFFDKEDFTGE